MAKGKGPISDGVIHLRRASLERGDGLVGGHGAGV